MTKSFRKFYTYILLSTFSLIISVGVFTVLQVPKAYACTESLPQISAGANGSSGQIVSFSGDGFPYFGSLTVLSGDIVTLSAGGVSNDGWLTLTNPENVTDGTSLYPPTSWYSNSVYQYNVGSPPFTTSVQSYKTYNNSGPDFSISTRPLTSDASFSFGVDDSCTGGNAGASVQVYIGGAVNVNATLDGAPWPSSGTAALNFTATAPNAGYYDAPNYIAPSGSDVPSTLALRPTNWQINYVSGGPAGATLSNSSISVNVSAAGNYTATFNFTSPQKNLSVSKAGTGSGTFSSNPAGINNCSSTCNANFNTNSTVTLTANPDVSSTFTGWSGNSDCSDGSVTMNVDKTCTATFNLKTYTLTVNTAGTGSGSVTGGGTYTYGQTPQVQAYNSAGSTFTGWTNCFVGTTNPLTVTMDANKTCTANFSLNTYTLNVSKGGYGSVTSNPAGINCGAMCSANYSYNTSVTLTATADLGNYFSGWSGEGCSGTGTCTVAMTQVRNVYAGFSPSAPGAFTLNSPTTSCSGATPQITISWNASAFASSYNVLRRPGGSGVAYTQIASNVTSPYTDSTVTSGSSYEYNVQAVNAGGSTTGTNSQTKQAYWCTGNITVNVTLNGSNYGGSVSYDILGPSTVNYTGTTPKTHVNQTQGTWTITNITGPSGASGPTITPSISQTIPGNQAAQPTTTYTLAYLSNPTLTVIKQGTGSGYVTSNIGGINCGNAPTPPPVLCSASMSNGTSVTLTEHLGANSTFAGWGIACSGSASTCTLTISGDTTVTATFSPVPPNPPTGVSANNTASCDRIQVSWTAPSGGPAPTGYNIYRSTGSSSGPWGSAVANNVSSPYLYTPPDATAAWYAVSTLAAGGLESSKAADPSSIAPIACGSNFSNSGVGITKVNGTPVSPQPSPCTGSSLAAPIGSTLKLGDTLTFNNCIDNIGNISSCSTGTLSLSLVNLNPVSGDGTSPSNWNAQMDCGSGPSAYSGGFSKSGDTSGTTLTFSSVPIIPVGGSCQITYDAKLGLPSGTQALLGHFQDTFSFTLNSCSGGKSAPSPYIQFFGGQSNLIRTEK